PTKLMTKTAPNAPSNSNAPTISGRLSRWGLNGEALTMVPCASTGIEIGLGSSGSARETIPDGAGAALDRTGAALSRALITPPLVGGGGRSDERLTPLALVIADCSLPNEAGRREGGG